jgi:hypothetical protein
MNLEKGDLEQMNIRGTVGKCFPNPPSAGNDMDEIHTDVG